MRLVRLPLGLGATREEADALRMDLLDEVGVETAFTSFRGVGYFRLSAHLYNEAADYEAFVERCVPQILSRAGIRRADSSSFPDRVPPPPDRNIHPHPTERHIVKNKILTTAAGFGTVAVLALTGCSASSGPSADGAVTLQMVESLTNPARTELLRGLLDDFEKANPKITVNLVSPPTEQADAKIQQMLQSGKGVDVLEVRDITVGPFANNGWLYDLGPDLEKWDGWDALTDNAQSASVAADGKSYFVPYGFYGLSLFYRTDLVKDAGFDGPPHSWKDLLEQASAIQDPSNNIYGYAFRGGQNANSNVVAAIEAYTIDGLDVDDAFLMEDGSTIFAAPEAQDAVDDYFDLFKKASRPPPSRGATPRWSPASRTAPPPSCCRTPRSSRPCRTPR